MSTSRCEQYRGVVCAQHIQSSIFLPAGQEQSDIEQELTAAFVRLQSMPDISETCERYIIPSICLTAFPLCDQGDRGLSVHKLCHDECNLLETDTCSDLYDYIDTEVELDLVGILPICSELPQVGEPGGETCMRLGLSDSGGEYGVWLFILQQVDESGKNCIYKYKILHLLCNFMQGVQKKID